MRIILIRLTYNRPLSSSLSDVVAGIQARRPGDPMRNFFVFLPLALAAHLACAQAIPSTVT
jgi:hypothetical protein